MLSHWVLHFEDLWARRHDKDTRRALRILIGYMRSYSVPKAGWHK